MELDLYLTHPRPMDVPTLAAQGQAAGFDGVWLTETAHDPFILSALAAQGADRTLIGTNIAVALARSPMMTAQSAWDLAALSGGRFVLGLGTQVKGHLERRLSAPSDRPAARLREYVLALRAIFDAFSGMAPLRFEGEFYRHTLLTDYFNPGPIEHPDVPIYVAGMNEQLAHVAGEVADGFCAHPMNSPEYLSKHLIPWITEGTKRAGRDRSAVTLVVPALVAVGDSDEELERQRHQNRLLIGFYGTTPSYRTMFEIHGLGDLPPRLVAAAKSGDTDRLAAEVPDELLDTLSVTASWDTLAEVLLRRFDGLVGRTFPYAIEGSLADPAVAERWRHVAETLRRGTDRLA
jgi:probable F420-dependent oxidoreductase